MVSLPRTEEERRSIIEDKRKRKAQKADTRRNPEKAHPTSEFNIVTKYGGVTLLRLASSLATVVRLAGRQTKISVLAIFKKVNIGTSVVLIYNARNEVENIRTLVKWLFAT